MAHKLYFTAFLLLFQTVHLLAQDKWLKGSITISNGRTYKTEFKLKSTHTEGIIMIRDGSTTLTFTPEKIQRFEYYDPYREAFRSYESIPIYLNGIHRAKKILLEILFKGSNISLLRRTYLMKKYKMGSLITSRVIRAESLYLYDLKYNEVIPYTDPTFYKKGLNKYYKPDKKTLLELLGENKVTVKNFIKNNGLNYGKVDDLIKILEFNETLK